MTFTQQRPLAAALSLALGLLVLAPAAAMAQEYGASPTPPTPEPAATTEVRATEARAPRGRAAAQAQEQVQPALFPGATRAVSNTRASAKMVKHLQALQALHAQADMAGVIAKAEEIAAMPAASAYEKSYVYSMAATAASKLDDQARTAAYFSKAVDTNGLDNDSHFSNMFNLAVVQYGLEDYPAALATVDRFLAETKSDKPEHLRFRAGILVNMDRHEEAAAIYKALVAKNPGDKALLMNAVATLQSADKFDQANVLLESAYKGGMLGESRELRALYVGYINAERWSDAQRIMDEGLAKGILQAGPDLARDYQVLAQNAYMDDKTSLAVELYAKAAPMAADGEAYLNLAKVLEFSGKKTEAKAAANQALAKGVKKPEEAKGILSR